MTITSLHWVPWCLAAYAVAAMLRPALTLPAGRRAPILLAGCLGLLVLPAAVPRDAPLGRAIVAVCAATLVIKLYDLHRGAGRGTVPSWPGSLLFLASPFCHVHRLLAAAPVPTARQNLIRIGRGVVLTAAGIAVFRAVNRAEPGSFLIEHALRVTFGFVVVYGCAEIAFALWSLAGLRGEPQFTNFFVARTPAEFWRRYNRPVTQYMLENVFRPAGGARAPVRATLLAFFVSGVLHEYIAGIALRDVQGFQLAFFMLQGAAVAATQKLRPRGRAVVIAAVAATMLFNIAVSLLFCASVAQVADLYSANAPAWMHAR